VCTLGYTDKKEKKIFLIYKEIQIGSVAKSYMRKGFLIYEEMLKYLVIYEEAVSHTIYDFATAPVLIYEKNLIYFLSVYKKLKLMGFTAKICLLIL
jgi:hypothetical protein